jgi:hypothetical protein
LLELRKNQIDITRVPFSDRGSRLLVFQHVNRPSPFVKLAERLIHVEPGISEYYGPSTGIVPATVIPAFGWMSAAFFELAIQASRESK